MSTWNKNLDNRSHLDRPWSWPVSCSIQVGLMHCTIEKLENLWFVPILIDSFVFVRSVGTFARALDCSSSVKQPSLHMSAAAASRDITQVRWGTDRQYYRAFKITLWPLELRRVPQDSPPVTLFSIWSINSALLPSL
jgi:hypothetical protein